MVPAGSILTYQAKGRTSYFQGEADLVQEMNSEFAQSNIIMRDYHSSWTSVGGAVDAYLGGPADFQFTATLQTNADFNAIADIQGIADHAIYTVTGTLPSSSVPNVTVPGQAATSTGQAAQVVPDTSSTSLGGILQGGVNSFALLAAGAIVAVILIVGGKQKGIL